MNMDRRFAANVCLANGIDMPAIGYGTYRMDGDSAYDAVRMALKTGYRHIDTAAYYRNEEAVGRAVADSGIPRSDVFVTSKLWNDFHSYREAKVQFERSLSALGFDYLDLYLIHWPAPAAIRGVWKERMLDTWKAFEELYGAGKIRAIGVSNFWKHHLEEILPRVQIRPMVDQIELHPGFPQVATVDYCRQSGIQVEAWQPLARAALFSTPLVEELSSQYGVTPAQLFLRWELQRGIVPLPKSADPVRIRENLEIGWFEISAQDMERITTMPEAGWSGLDPDRVAF